MTTTREAQIIDFLNSLNLEIDLDYLNYDNIDCFDSLYNELQNNRSLDVEIIYYYNAIEYLKDNDPSLTESLEIASKFGYDCANVNSELLASLHATKENESEFMENESEINDFFDNL